MKEKFTKLFGALILVALMLGLVLPFQTAAAEEITGTASLTVVASEGVTTVEGVNVILSPVGITPVDGDGSYFKLSRSTTESGTRTPITVAAAAELVAITVTDSTAVAGTEYWYWGNICDPTSCSATISDTGWKFVNGGTTFAAAAVEGYDRITINIDQGDSAALVTGGSYVIYRSDHLADDFSELASITTFTYADLTAEGQLLDGSPLATYDYQVDICGVDKCLSDNKTTGDFVDVGAGDFHRTVPIMSTVFATKGEVVGKVDVTWAAVTGANMYYGWRSFGATNEPATPVVFPATATGGSDLWAVAGREYTYHVYVCSLGTENCSAPKTDTGYILGADPVVSGLVASDGNVVNAAGTPVIYITWPAATWPVVISDTLPNAEATSNRYYNLYRSDDPAGQVNLVTIAQASEHLDGAIMFYYDYNVDLGQTYYYYVRACIGNPDLPSILGQNEGFQTICYDPSNVDSGWALIPAPSITLTNSTSGVTATWTGTEVNVTYLGFRSPTSNFADAIPVGGVALTGLTGTDTTGVAGTTYYYFLKACLGTLCSEPSVGKPGIKLIP